MLTLFQLEQIGVVLPTYFVSMCFTCFAKHVSGAEQQRERVAQAAQVGFVVLYRPQTVWDALASQIRRPFSSFVFIDVS